MNLVVGVGDMKTGCREDMIVTHALGSCLGLMAYDPAVQIGGLLHAMLPLSKINLQKASENPFMFVDTGVPEMFRQMCDLGAQKSRMVIKTAGCGQPLGNSEMFKFGERNYGSLKKLLWKNNMVIAAEDVGGIASRTVYFDLSTGQVTISSKGVNKEL